MLVCLNLSKTVVEIFNKTQIIIDFQGNENQLETIKNHNIALEFKTLQTLIDYSSETAERFFQTDEIEKNRYSDIFPCNYT